MKASKTQGGTLGDKKFPNPRGGLWVTKNCETIGGCFGDKPAQPKGGPWVTTNSKTKERQLTYKTCKIKGATLGEEKSSKPKRDPWWQFPNSRRDPCMTKTCETKGDPLMKKTSETKVATLGWQKSVKTKRDLWVTNLWTSMEDPWVTKIFQTQGETLADKKPFKPNGGQFGDKNLWNLRGSLVIKKLPNPWRDPWVNKNVKPKKRPLVTKIFQIQVGILGYENLQNPKEDLRWQEINKTQGEPLVTNIFQNQRVTLGNEKSSKNNGRPLGDKNLGKQGRQWVTNLRKPRNWN